VISGYPAEVYNYGVQFYMMILGAGLFQPIAIYMIVSVLYYLNLTSTYQVCNTFIITPMDDIIANYYLITVSGNEIRVEIPPETMRGSLHSSDLPPQRDCIICPRHTDGNDARTPSMDLHFNCGTLCYDIHFRCMYLAV